VIRLLLQMLSEDLATSRRIGKKGMSLTDGDRHNIRCGLSARHIQRIEEAKEMAVAMAATLIYRSDQRSYFPMAVQFPSSLADIFSNPLVAIMDPIKASRW